jgi:hypothetical protein
MDICTIPDPANVYTTQCTLIKTMEYMAQGKPIVAFDLPETRYSAQDAAIYLAPGDERGFAQALSELMDDPARRAVMGLAGRQRAEEKLAWRHQVPNLLSVYERLTGCAATPHGSTIDTHINQPVGGETPLLQPALHAEVLSPNR